jgi:hypothetical protein
MVRFFTDAWGRPTASPTPDMQAWLGPKIEPRPLTADR